MKELSALVTVKLDLWHLPDWGGKDHCLCAVVFIPLRADETLPLFCLRAGYEEKAQRCGESKSDYFRDVALALEIRCLQQGSMSRPGLPGEQEKWSFAGILLSYFHQPSDPDPGISLKELKFKVLYSSQYYLETWWGKGERELRHSITAWNWAKWRLIGSQ